MEIWLWTVAGRILLQFLTVLKGVLMSPRLLLKLWIEESYWFENLKHHFCCFRHNFGPTLLGGLLSISVLLLGWGWNVTQNSSMSCYISPWSHWTLQTNRLGLFWFLLSLIKITVFWNIIFCSSKESTSILEDPVLSSSNGRWRQQIPLKYWFLYIPYYIGVISQKTNVNTHRCENLRFHSFSYIFQYPLLNKIWIY